MATVRSTEQILADLGRSQKAYQDYKAAGRTDLSGGATKYADKVRQEAAAAGIDLNQYGTANSYGRDFTSYYNSSAPAGQYDPTKTGIVQRTQSVDSGTGTDTGTGTGGTVTGGNTNAQGYIDELTAARKRNALAGLERSRNNALSNLDAEKAGIQPRYYDARNATAAGSQQSARNFAEFMASRGGTSSGANAQGELSRGMTLQSNLGSLGRQENQALDEVARRRTDTQNDFESARTAAESGADAEKLSMLLNDFYAAQDRGDRLEQNRIQNELSKAGLTGFLNGDRTLPGQQFDYGKQTDQRNFDFQKAQTEWDNNFKQGQFDWTKGQQIWENTFKEKNFEQQVKDAAAARGLQWANLDESRKSRIADETFRQKQYNHMLQQDAKQNGQAKFAQGMETFKTTGKMPSYMNEYGIDINAINTPLIKDDVTAMYGMLSSGKTPESILQTIDDKVALGLEDASTGEQLKSSLYKLYPNLDPSSQGSTGPSPIKPGWMNFNWSLNPFDYTFIK